MYYTFITLLRQIVTGLYIHSSMLIRLYVYRVWWVRDPNPREYYPATTLNPGLEGMLKNENVLVSVTP